MRIAYVCQYFVPEPGAPSARLHDLGRAWQAMGHSVTVVTGFPNHPTGRLREGDRGKLWTEEQESGLRVLRNWLYATPNEGFVKKTLGHLSFMVTSFAFGLPRLGRTDVVIASSPSFFCAISAWLMARVRRACFVFEVRDLWPAVFVDLGVLRSPPLIRLLEAVELFLYRRAELIVTVTESFRHDIVRRGIPAEKVVTVINGADVDFFVPGPRQNAVRDELELGERFVVLYIGAHGISHPLETVVEAAAILRDRRDVVFLLVGDGARRRHIEQLVSSRALSNVIMLPAQPKERMPDFYRAADVCLVPLRDVPLFSKFIPSKIFEIQAAGRPIIGSVAGEARDLLERSGGAVLVPPENAEALVDAVVGLAADRPRCERLGIAGREFVVRECTRAALAARYLAALIAAGARA
jgi:hypothetical protein